MPIPSISSSSGGWFCDTRGARGGRRGIISIRLGRLLGAVSKMFWVAFGWLELGGVAVAPRRDGVVGLG